MVLFCAFVPVGLSLHLLCGSIFFFPGLNISSPHPFHGNQNALGSVGEKKKTSQAGFAQHEHEYCPCFEFQSVD